MFIVWGTEAYGTLERGAGVRVATLFAHVYGLPIAPSGSFVGVTVPGRGEVMLLLRKYHKRSLLLGWCVTLFPFLGLLLGLVTFPLIRFACLPLGIGLGAVAAAAFMLATPMDASANEAVRRNLRSRWMGAPLNASFGVHNAQAVEGALLSFLETRARGFGGTYRESSAQQTYRRIALDPSMTDGDYLVAAATYCELEAARNVPGAQADADAIWTKLVTLYPEVVNAQPWFVMFDGGVATARPVKAPRRERGAIAAFVGAAGLLSLVVTGSVYHAAQHPRVYVVNVHDEAMEVTVDGKPLDAGWKSALGVKVKDQRLAKGHHHLVAKVGGEIVDERDVDLLPNSDGYAYAPTRDVEICFGIERVLYGNASGKGDTTWVSSTGGFARVEQGYIDDWFEDPPKTIQTKSSGGSRKVLFAIPCAAKTEYMTTPR